jgi:hypothetical protein
MRKSVESSHETITDWLGRHSDGRKQTFAGDQRARDQRLISSQSVPGLSGLASGRPGSLA